MTDLDRWTAETVEQIRDMLRQWDSGHYNATVFLERLGMAIIVPEHLTVTTPDPGDWKTA